MLKRHAQSSLYLNAARLLAGARGTVYKWVDENGVVHYSDQPHPNAQKMQVQEAQTYTAPALSARARRPQRRLASNGAVKPTRGARSCSRADQTLS